jgi:hypothetical protein
LANEITGNAVYGNGTHPGSVFGVAPGTPPYPFDLVDLTPAGGATNNIAANYCLLGSPAALCVPQQPDTLASIVIELVAIDALPDIDGVAPDVSDGLLDKVRAAQGAFNRGQSRVAALTLQAFTHQVDAKRGNGISPAASDLLTQQATLVIAGLP